MQALSLAPSAPRDPADPRLWTPMKRRQAFLRRLEALRNERATWVPTWWEINNFIRPGKFRYLEQLKNNGTKQDQYIINNTGVIAGRTTASGMMAAITPRAQPWFRLGTPNPALAASSAVKGWLYAVEELIRTILARSNVYNGLHDTFRNLADFCTAALYIEEDPEHIVRAEVFPIGQYTLASSAAGIVNTVYRELSMTTAQVVEKFCTQPDGSVDLSNVSRIIAQQWKDQKLDEWHEIVHVIEPRAVRDPSKADAKNKRYLSVWFEKNGDATTGLLRESGYDEFPVCAPRWETTGEDVYGRGPGFDALGDAQTLQLYERRLAQAVERIVDPPSVADASLKAQRVSLLPGDITYVARKGEGPLIEPVLEVPPEVITVTQAQIERTEQRLNRTYFVDLWLSLLQDEGPQMTAEEVRERHEEKIFQLGPVAERLDMELLDRLIGRVFGIALRLGLLPPPPPEMQGQPITVVYTSIMAQAQKLLGSQGLQRLVAFVGNMVAIDPEVVDNIDADSIVGTYADALDLAPNVIRSADAVAARRQQRAQAQQQQAMAQQALAATQGAKNLASADLSGNNALSALLPPVAGGGQ